MFCQVVPGAGAEVSKIGHGYRKSLLTGILGELEESKLKWNEVNDMKENAMNECIEMNELKRKNWNKWIETNELKWMNWNEWIEMNELKWMNWNEWIEMNELKWMNWPHLPKLLRTWHLYTFFQLEIEPSPQSCALFVDNFPRSSRAPAATTQATLPE